MWILYYVMELMRQLFAVSNWTINHTINVIEFGVMNLLKKHLRPLEVLDSIRAALEEALGIKFEGEKGDHFFRSTLIQTLFYGIFSSWVLWSKKHKPTDKVARFNWHEAAWSLHVPMIRALFGQALAHLGETTCDIYLNETAYWKNVPARYGLNSTCKCNFAGWS